MECFGTREVDLKHAGTTAWAYDTRRRRRVCEGTAVCRENGLNVHLPAVPLKASMRGVDSVGRRRWTGVDVGGSGVHVGPDAWILP